MSTMSRSELAAALQATLHDVTDFFEAGDMARLLDIAALDFNALRPRTALGNVTLEADLAVYPCPDDLYLFKSSLWGIAPARRAQPWESNWPGQLPKVQVIDDGVARILYLAPTPTARQIGILGSEFRFYYFGNHVVHEDAARTTIRAGDRGLLLLRAQAEAMRELATRNVNKPVQMRDSTNSSPKNMTPAALFTLLMDEWTGKVHRIAP